MPFQKDNKYGKGGKRKNSGRDADWLKEKCQKLIEKKKLFEWLSDVAAGEDVETSITYDKENHPHKSMRPADTKDRLKALEMLADRGWGKPAQAVELGGDLMEQLLAEVRKRYA